MSTDTKKPAFSVTYRDLPVHLEAAIFMKKPLFLWGATGIGKTEIANATFDKEGYTFFDLFVAARESIDFGGVPYVMNGLEEGDTEEDKRMSFALPRLIPLENDHCPDIFIVFLDELPLASEMTQSVLYKIIDEGMVGHKHVHENVRWLAAGNRVKDRGRSNPPPPALNNRFRHIDLMLDSEGSLAYAQKSGWHSAVTSYLHDNPSHWHAMHGGAVAYKNATEEIAFQTNRSWKDLSDLLFYAEKEGITNNRILTQFVASCVGTTISHTFMPHFNLMSVVPAMKDILEGVVVGTEVPPSSSAGVVKPSAPVFDRELSHAQQYYLVYSLSNSINNSLPSLSDPMAMKERFAMLNEVGSKLPQYLENAFYFVKSACKVDNLSTYITVSVTSLRIPVSPKLSFYNEIGEGAVSTYSNYQLKG